MQGNENDFNRLELPGSSLGKHGCHGLFSCYDLTAETLEGETFSFADLKGKRVMIVNTASRCGYTPQYKPLEALYKRCEDKDFVILGFLATNLVVSHLTFVDQNYGVSFRRWPT